MIFLMVCIALAIDMAAITRSMMRKQLVGKILNVAVLRTPIVMVFHILPIKDMPLGNLTLVYGSRKAVSQNFPYIL